MFIKFLMIEQNFLSPKVKQSMIISKKIRIHEFPHELPNDFRHGILGN